MADTDQMSPDSSPGASSKKTGVRRVNNVPLMIGIAVLALFMGLIAMVAVKRSNQANVEHAATAQGKGGDSSLMAADIVGGRADGLIPEAKAEPPLLPPADPQAPTTPNGVPVARVENPNAPPQPPRGNGGPRSPEDQEDEQLRQRKMQLFQTAVGAKTAITLPDLSRVGTGTTDDTPKTPDEMVDRIAQVRRQIDQQRSTDPNAAYQAQLRQVQGNMGGGSGGGYGGGRSGGSSGMMLASSSSDTGKDYGTFDGNGKKDRWALNSKMEAPTTPFEIRAGAVIPGIMLSGINSDLPGQIMAQVSQDVYDTATGKYLLIPQGTRMVGTYSSDVGYGQEGVLIAWQRLVFPDGKALDIGASQAQTWPATLASVTR